MMQVLAAEGGASLPRATEDMDVLVDVRVRTGATAQLASWLQSRGLVLEGTSPDGVGHRLVKSASPGPGAVQFDILAPEGLGPRASLLTVPPARTLEVPGGTRALQLSRRLRVAVVGYEGPEAVRGGIWCPDLLGGLIAKAAATTIAARQNPERDWQDAALLLSLVQDPIDMADRLTRGDRARLSRLQPLMEADHASWRVLDAKPQEMGRAALDFLVAGDQ